MLGNAKRDYESAERGENESIQAALEKMAEVSKKGSETT